jgi:hypothetical protein
MATRKLTFINIALSEKPKTLAEFILEVYKLCEGLFIFLKIYLKKIELIKQLHKQTRVPEYPLNRLAITFYHI